MHELSIFNSIGRHIETLKPHIAGLEFIRLDIKHNEWAVFRTAKPIYATGSSGELRYMFSDQGNLVHFWHER